jgi:hypothetical protein
VANRFNVRTTSASSAKINDVRLDKPPEPDTTLTRKIVRPELVDNAHSDEARVKIAIVHQKRHMKHEDWQDAPNFNAATLKSGQEIKLSLSSGETFQLYQTLKGLYAVTKDGIPQKDGTLAVIDESKGIALEGKAAELVRRLTERSSDEFWEAVQKLEPYLFQAVALTKLHEVRERAVLEFYEHLEAEDWKEAAWQRFFENNTWIFGYGLDYRFLTPITEQPYYGGKTVRGSDGQRGDFLAAPVADQRFTVLVEIKRPDSVLVETETYRNKVHILGEDLTGGVTQLQSNCRTWEVEGSRTDDNREVMAAASCHTFQPKGILVIGHTEQLDNQSKRATFELFRRNLQNPDVITFDELYERAKHLLLVEEKEFEKKSAKGVKSG